MFVLVGGIYLCGNIGVAVVGVGVFREVVDRLVFVVAVSSPRFDVWLVMPRRVCSRGRVHSVVGQVHLSACDARGAPSPRHPAAC